MPTLIDRIKRVWTGPKNAGVGIFALNAGQQGITIGISWDFLRIANSVYGNPTGYRCIEAISSNFSRPNWMLLPPGTQWPQVSSETQAIKKNPLLDLLNRPNVNMSATQMQRAMARDLELTGKSFWLKMQGTDGFGNQGPVTGLRRLPPQRVSVVGNQDDELLGFVYTDRNGRQAPILPESVVYLRFPHPERIFDGMAPGLIAGLPAETDTAGARFNRDLLANDSAVPGYLILEGLTPDQFAQWRNEWEQKALPGKTRFLRGSDAKYVRAGQTNQELTYVELRADSQDDIMRAFGVPRAVAFDVSHETYANAEREQAIFMQHNILPKWVLVADEMTLQLGNDFGVRIAFDLAGIDELQDSRDAIVERGVKLMSYKAMTINEFRRSQGWSDVDWGDEPDAPLQAMSAVPLQPGGDGGQQPAPGGQGPVPKPALPGGRQPNTKQPPPPSDGPALPAPQPGKQGASNGNGNGHGNGHHDELDLVRADLDVLGPQLVGDQLALVRADLDVLGPELETLTAYSPSQPRDYHGRWDEVGGGGANPTTVETQGSVAAYDGLVAGSLPKGASAGDATWILKDRVAAQIAKDSRRRLTPRRAAEIGNAWAWSSSDTQPDAVALQTAAAEKFGVDSGDFLRGRAEMFAGGWKKLDPHSSDGRLAREAESMLPWKRRLNDARAYLDAMYAGTQRQLAKAGVESITVFRSMHWNSESDVPASLRGGVKGKAQATSITANPLSSTSVSSRYAAEFSAGRGATRLYAIKVPRSQVVSLPSSGIGGLSEGEVVIAGGTTPLWGGAPKRSAPYFDGWPPVVSESKYVG